MRRFLSLFSSAGAVLLIVSGAIIFISVILRKAFATQIPDTNDFSRLIMGIAITIGIAFACYRGQQITMDSVWTMLSRRGRQWMDVLATAITLGAIGTMTWMLIFRVFDAAASREATFDVRVPIWTFYSVAGFAAVVATWLTLVRLWRLWRGDVSGEPASREGESASGPGGGA